MSFVNPYSSSSSPTNNPNVVGNTDPASGANNQQDGSGSSDAANQALNGLMQALPMMLMFM
ncbi:hypothetical protein [Paraburkholderia sp. CI3]|uniref:hypothetical protein n=1 Tax=Paraburkholderia sp. CI3 TaxID=2991060 RepID=UPI003D1EBD13